MASVILELISRYRHRGMRGGEAEQIAAATLVAWNEQRDARDAREMFGVLAERLRPQFMGDALEATRDWLTDPGLSAPDWEAVDDSLRFLQHRTVGPIDWNAEVAACLDPQRRQEAFSLSLALGRSMSRLLDLPISGTLACLYSASASVAWVLAEERDVTLFADHDVAIMIALLARAACRTLSVSRQNPIDGSFMPAPYVHDSPGHQPPFERFDYIFSAPPFGYRINDGPYKGVPFEAYHLGRLVRRATKSFSALIPDGLLFREAKFEMELRRELIDRNRVTVMSLPSGIFWPATGISTSLLHIEPAEPGGACMIDARSMEKTSSGRVQEGLITQHLEQFRSLRSKDSERTARVSFDELAENQFSLLPDRYVKSGNLALIEKALARRKVTTLGDVATVERNKAPLPIRDAIEDPPLTAMEIAPMDIANGQVRTPTKQQAFELDERSRLHGVTVRPDDILVSIKGNVGNVGIVGTGAMLAEQMSDPWIVSQSLAIVRLKPNPYISSPAVLNALLTAPWVREKLESMSGGTTVRLLPMSALRSLGIPVPTAEECQAADADLDDIANLRDQIEEQQQTLAERQRLLWSQLWHVPIDFGDE